MCFRDAAMLTSACLTLVIWSSMSSYDRSSISSGRSAASSALLALALTMSWARWKRDIPACFLSATACTCLPASTLRRPAPGLRWPAASGRPCALLDGGASRLQLAVADVVRRGPWTRDEGLGTSLDPQLGKPPVDRSGQPPVRPAQQMHDRWNEQHPYHGCVDRDRRRHAYTDDLEDDLGAWNEREEHRDHDGSSGGDDPAGPGQAVDDGPRPVPVRAQPRLPHPADKEHLVVHREPEQHGEHQHRNEGGHRRLGVDADQLAGPPSLEEER